MKKKPKAITTKSTQANLAKYRAHLKDQFRAMNPRHADGKRQREITNHEITKRLFEPVRRPARRGSEDYHRGYDDGLFLGGLQRDYQLPNNKQGYLRNLEADMKDCRGEAEKVKATLSAKARADYARGFSRGMKVAAQQPTDAAHPDARLAWLWNRMPQILSRCQNIPELFHWYYGTPAKNNTNWPAFQKLCQRLGITLRPSGRPRKTVA